MAIDPLQRHSVLQQFIELVKLMNRLEKEPRHYGTAEQFTSREIHLVEMIGMAGGISVTELAKRLGVTKGAISQSLKRLDQRGLIRKQADQSNLSRARIDLTIKGKIAYTAHRSWHDTMDGGFSRYFEALNADQIAFLQEFLGKTRDFFARRLLSAAAVDRAKKPTTG
jgi:DNA-binding MarR family transcriptional regulator